MTDEPKSDEAPSLRFEAKFMTPQQSALLRSENPACKCALVETVDLTAFLGAFAKQFGSGQVRCLIAVFPTDE